MTRVCYHANHFNLSGNLTLKLAPLTSQLPGFGENPGTASQRDQRPLPNAASRRLGGSHLPQTSYLELPSGWALVRGLHGQVLSRFSSHPCDQQYSGIPPASADPHHATEPRGYRPGDWRRDTGWKQLFAKPTHPGYPEADTAVNISTSFTQMARMNSHCGIIKIEVLQARGLIPVTMLGMAHPYVELTADGEKGCRRAGPRNRPRFT